MSRSVYLAIVAYWGILTLRGDGTFPFPRSWDPAWLRLALMAQYLPLLGLTGYLGYQALRNQEADRRDAGREAFPAWAEHGLALALIFGIGLMQWMQAGRFREMGYVLNAEVWSVWVLGSMALYGVIRRWIGLSWVAAIAAMAVLKVFPILYFPLVPERSDMLPFIQAAGGALLNGEGMYRYFVLENGALMPNVRLPGIVAAYLPAVAWKLDLRWMNLVYEILALGLIGMMGRSLAGVRSRFGVAGLVGLFSLIPYWHVRHELYEPPFWLALVVFFWALSRQGWWKAAAVWGVLIGTHQWAWMWSPLVGIYFVRKQGWARALQQGTVALAVGVGLIGLGAKGTWMSIPEHLFGFYTNQFETGTFHLMSLYFTESFNTLGLKGMLFPLQVFGQLILLAFAWRLSQTRLTAGNLAAWMALSLTVQLAFNAVAWTYQYLLVGLLWILAFRSEPFVPSHKATSRN